MTTFSPCTEGSELTRASTSCPSTAIRVRPSCGSLRSPMSSPETIFSRLTTDASALRGTDMTSRSTPSTRYRIRRLSRCGSMWMSLAPIRTASASTMLTSRTVGAASLVEAPSSSSAGPVSSKNVETSEESSASDQARVSWSEIWLSVATITTSSVAPVCSRTSSSATTSVGSLAASVSRRPSLDRISIPSRRATPRGSSRTASGEMTTRFRSTTSSRSWSASASVICRSVTTPRSTSTWPSRRRDADHGPLGVQGCRELRLGDHLGVDEHVTEPAAVPARFDTEPARRRAAEQSCLKESAPAADFFRTSRAVSRRPDLARGCGAPPAPRAAGAARSAGSRGWRRRRARSGRRRELAGEVLGVGDVALGPGPVLLVLHPVAVGLAVLREQDQRGRVGGLQREHQGEQR